VDPEGKTALVTGGASGIGRCLVDTLVAAGSRVVVLDLDVSNLAAASTGTADILALTCDVSDSAAVEAAVAEAIRKVERIDILVNCAGIMKSAPLVNALERKKHSFDLWQQVIDVNLSGTFYVCACVAEHMVAKRIKGVIVNISSISARGNAGQGAYAASKAGVEAMTKAWAKELGPLGIRCAAVAPGFVETEGGNEALSEATVAQWVEKTPLRRRGRPEEVAEAVLHVVQNGFLNGKVVELDGGLTV